MGYFRSSSFIRALAIALGSTLFILVVIGAGIFSAARQRANHLLYTSEQVSDNIVIVAIDDASLQAFGRSPTEWTRKEYAPVIEALARAGARVIGLELLLTEPARGDEELVEAIQAARAGETRTRFVIPASGGGTVRPVTIEGGNAATRFQTRLMPIGTLARTVDYVGFSNVLLDPAGSQCCQLSFVSVNQQTWLSYSLATYLAYLRIPIEALNQVVYTQGDRLFVTPERSLVVDEYGQWLQNYIAPTGRGFQTLSFVDVANGIADLSMVRDRIVLIGLKDSVGAVDTYDVPVSSNTLEMSGVEIQANAIETLIQNNALRPATRLEILTFVLVLTLISALVYEHLRWYLRPLAFIGISIVMIVLASYMYSVQLIILPILDGAFATAMPLVVGLAAHLQQEAQKRRLAEFAATIAERERSLLEDVILGAPTPTAILSNDLGIVTLNRAFSALLNTQGSASQRTNFLELLESEGMIQDDLDGLQKALHHEQDFETQITFKNHSYQSAANWLPHLKRWVIGWADVSILTEMNEMKRHMLLMVSHDLRNPLTSILMQFHQMKRLIKDAAILKTVDAAEAAAKTMQHILTDVVDLEQVRTVSFPSSKLNLEEITRTILERYRPDADLKQHTLQLMVEKPNPCIIGNDGQIRQMMANLVSNAIKYTLTNGTITVALKAGANDHIRIEVKDTGVGIPKSAQSQIFTEFYRAKSRATSEVPGTGLGLSLVKTIVKKYGGRIWFESEEGIGTTFYVEFPRAAT
jgi:signal transduction histidine kinase/CHASE2 domain-containing sensor protein